MNSPRLDRVVTHGGLPLPTLGQDSHEYQRQVESHAQQLHRQGITHLMINYAVASLPWTMDPLNSYLRFTEYGYPLNQFVSSSYDVGIYYEKMMKLNLDLMLHQAALARKHGFRAYVMCVEPTFMQESLFQRYPAWRGPRVDNPACSTKPLFAPCVLIKEVQDHYAQILKKVITLVPELDEYHIFTNDTGAGFCYSSHLYSGSNGPVHCKATSPGKHAQIFAKALLDAGRSLNPNFRVVMTSGLGPHEKLDYIHGAGEGLAASVYGAFAWAGGLEDYWGTMAIGPAAWKDPAARQRVRQWQQDDMRARFEPLKNHGCRVYVSYNPLYYRADDPRPYETHRITCDLLNWGMTDLIGGAPAGEYSINGAVMRHAMKHGPTQTHALVHDIASQWVGHAHAPTLCQAWEHANLASNDQPMLAHGGHAVMLQPLIQHFPLVPDESQLAPGALDYFLTPVIRDQQAMKSHQGGVWRILHYEQSTLIEYIQQYQSHTLVHYHKALELIEQLQSQCSDQVAKDCLKEQHAIIQSTLFGHTYIYTWLLAALHKLSHCQAPADLPSLQQVIDMQLELAPKLANRPQRIELMNKHRHDTLVRVDLSEFAPTRHAGTAGWEGAHEKQKS